MIERIQWKYLLVILILAGLGIVFTFISRKREWKEQKRLADFITKEYEVHPKMTSQDLYKFLHQAAMGSEHAVQDTGMVKDWMKNEIAGLDMTIENKLIDTLSEGGGIIRVHLRPYLKDGNNPDKLVNAFIKTANRFKGSKETLKQYLATARKMIKKKEISLDLAEFNNLTKEMESKGFPAVHHSKEYVDAYKPAYRVISSEYLPELLKK
jgi:hypothetical protein